jgi:hypothetical protein
LANGTRLKVHNNFRIVMETPDLHMTSPATITRCNVIHLDEHDIDKKALIAKELPALSSKEFTSKLVTLLNEFNAAEIMKVSKLARLVFHRKLDEEGPLN